jgi:hypothetical protein
LVSRQATAGPGAVEPTGPIQQAHDYRPRQGSVFARDGPGGKPTGAKPG